MKGLSAGMGSGDLQSKENHKNNFSIDLESSLNVYSSPFKMEKKNHVFFRFPLFSHKCFCFLFITKY